MTENKIQSLWIGSQLSNVERLCIQSFLDHGHDFFLYTYEDIKNAPKGTTVLDAREIAPESAIFKNKDGWGKGSVSGFADLFRILLVQKNGGWWVDMDIVCLKKFNFTSDQVFCSSYEGEYGALVNNCVFKSYPDSPFLKACLSYIDSINLSTMSFGTAGIFMFQSIVKELGLENDIVPYSVFNPIGWRNVGELILGKMDHLSKLKEVVRPLMKPNTMPGRKIRQDGFSVHFWNEVWNSNGYDKNGTYSKHSLFEKLKLKHSIK